MPCFNQMFNIKEIVGKALKIFLTLLAKSFILIYSFFIYCDPDIFTLGILVNIHFLQKLFVTEEISSKKLFKKITLLV